MIVINYPGSLHNHTDFSNLRLRDCIVKIQDLIDYALELNHEVIAITDHECVSNAIKVQKYYNKIKEKNPNFKVILGNEIYLCRNGLSSSNFISGEDKFYHFILLAKDAKGHQQIREISTRAWKRSYSTGKMIRVPTYYQDLIDIIGADPGHVIGSTACLGGALPTQILRQASDDDLRGWCRSMLALFGEDNFYLELQPSNNEEQITVNKKLLQLSSELNIPFIITNDTHYLKKEDASIHKAYLNSQDGDREVDSFYATTYLMDTQELESFFDNDNITQMAYQNIMKIKNSCVDYDLTKPLKIPRLTWRTPIKIANWSYWFDNIPYLQKFVTSDYEGDHVLAKIIVEKIDEDVTLQNEETYNEINENLKMTWISSEVNKTHWSAYFLNLQKIIDVCWEAGSLVGPGRGSGVGFLLLYILGITQINPLRETTPTFAWRLTDGLKASFAWRQAQNKPRERKKKRCENIKIFLLTVDSFD